MPNSIVIISDDEIIGKALRIKLSSLREVDSIKIAPFKNAVFEIESNVPDVVIIFSPIKDETIFGFLKTIKSTVKETNSSVLLVGDEIDEDFVVNSFDAGVYDFISLKASDVEILMSVISCIKKNELLKEIELKNKILVDLNVLQPETGFYLKEYSKKVFESEIELFQKNGEQAVFMAVSTDIKCKTQLPPANLGMLIKKCARAQDKIGFYSDDKFYVLLARTDAKGAISVYERMKKELSEDCSVSVGACEIENLFFDDLEKNVTKSMMEALELGNSIVVYDSKKDNEPMNWLDNDMSGQKNFKFFQAAFIKKLENVITPVFYQLQQIWEDKLFNTKVEQYCNETESMFILKYNDYSSSVKITYPGFAKININFSHSFEGVLPKERLSLDLNELDTTKLTEIVVDFIKEFQYYTKDLS